MTDIRQRSPTTEMSTTSDMTRAEIDEHELTLEEKAKRFDEQVHAVDRLSLRLMEAANEDEQNRLICDDLDISTHALKPKRRSSRLSETTARRNMSTMLCLAVGALCCLVAIVAVGMDYIGPPKQPVGPYHLIEAQEGEGFFQHYDFYVGRDSAGSNGYNTYIGREKAEELGICNITFEKDSPNVYSLDDTSTYAAKEDEHFIYMASSPTDDGPRMSLRLEGKRRFNKGLFIIDLRHMPAGCGVWPAFWLTDEENWPVNGEIDIVEGVNYQDVAKTALHSTRECTMEDVPVGVKTGTWDTAVGIPDRDTGIPDMTLRYAKDCFVYNPHQWLNQGCVAVDAEGDSIGVPFNEKGGGVYVLEWDPINRHIRSWVFSPHTKVPDNLRDAILSANADEPIHRIKPDPAQWPLPYGYFAIGENTDCPSYHFKNMRLVFNLAFCGSVAGNRYQIDCVKQASEYATCNDYIKSQPEELSEAFWKIKGVYVYERVWERAWV